ncbi:hypothetical protein [Thalassotalea marina]|nr:hypothetical protein [Thalassotalea marina]
MFGAQCSRNEENAQRNLSANGLKSKIKYLALDDNISQDNQQPKRSQ